MHAVFSLTQAGITPLAGMIFTFQIIESVGGLHTANKYQWFTFQSEPLEIIMSGCHNSKDESEEKQLKQTLRSSRSTNTETNEVIPGEMALLKWPNSTVLISSPDLLTHCRHLAVETARTLHS